MLGLFSIELIPFADTVIYSFGSLNDHLFKMTKCNSTLTAEGSVNSLIAISELQKLGDSSLRIIIEFLNALPKMASHYLDVIWSLYVAIGPLVRDIIGLFTDMIRSIVRYLRQFLNWHRDRKQQFENISTEVMVRSAMSLISTIALIADTALTECDNSTYAHIVYEAIKILALIAYHCFMSIQGSMANAAFIISKNGTIPKLYFHLFEAIDRFLEAIANRISSQTYGKKEIRQFLKTLVDETLNLSCELERLLRPLNDVKVKVSDIKKNLVKSQGN